MKKILLIMTCFMVSLNGFSVEKNEKKSEKKIEEKFVTYPDAIGNTCNFIKQKDKYLESVISKLQKEQKVTDLMCDSDELKMAYYVLDDEGYSFNIGIGLMATNTIRIIDFNRNFEKKILEYKEFFDSLNETTKVEKPKKIYVRYYGLVGNKRFFYLGKQEITPNGNKFYAFPDIKSTADNFGFFNNINIEYKDDRVVY